MNQPSIKSFDPASVARLDTQMWQAYYSHNFPKLFKILAKLFAEQFGVNKTTATRMAYYAMQAARLFRMTSKLEDVEDYLRKYYRLLARHAKESFDPVRAAESELQWWIVHRHPESGDLIEALAENMAILYKIPQAKLTTYATERAKAMKLRDVATNQDKQEPDWQAINRHLEKSYTALLQAVSKN